MKLPKKETLARFYAGKRSSRGIENLIRQDAKRKPKKESALAIPRQKWVYQGHAGHFICADSCCFKIATRIGDHLVSTVGEYRSPIDKGFSDIGYNRKFETMVFNVVGLEADGCAKINPAEIDMEGYGTCEEAAKGHDKMCVKYSTIARRFLKAKARKGDV